MRKIITAFSFLCLISYATTTIAQDSFRSNFNEANKRMDESLYSNALPLWLKLYKQDSTNSNINYKVGLCYMKSAKDQTKAIPYLEKAVKNTTTNYDIYSAGEKSAPIESYFFLARSFHYDYKFDSAKKYYDVFLGKITKKHYLYKAAVHDTEAVDFAANAIKHPVKIKVTNLGPTINTKYPEYSPVVSVDESQLYFTSRRLRADSSNYGVVDPNDGMYFEDIYESDKVNGQWTTPKLLKNIDTPGHEATLNISADGTKLFIYKDDKGDGNVYVSHYNGSEWGKPEKLGAQIDGTYDEDHAAITPDGKQLYFVSNRLGGFGGKDIWFCNKLPNGKWALPQNAGPVINTPEDEDGVFIHPDNKTMYFSSKGHPGMGGYDIFYSVRDKNGKWGKPVNMGYPINSVGDDVFFVTSADGKRAYFSSSKKGGYGHEDIYMAQLLDAKAKELTLLIGTVSVKGDNSLPEDAMVTVTDSKTGNLVGKYRPRHRDGKFTIIIPPGSDYHFVYSAGGYTAQDDIFVPAASSFQEIKRSIELKPIVFGNNKGKQVAENNQSTKTKEANSQPAGNNSSNSAANENNNLMYVQHFGYNQTAINTKSASYKKFITEASAILKKKGSIILTVEASSSSVPTKTFGTNTKLAKKRADVAKSTIINSLKKKGYDASKIKFNDISSSVTGPKYKHDAYNKAEYKKYQYVKVH